MDIVAQIWIGIFGASAVFLVGMKDRRIARLGYLAGLIGQPAWIYTTWHNEQWGILALVAVYTFSWVNGLINNWSQERG